MKVLKYELTGIDITSINPSVRIRIDMEVEPLRVEDVTSEVKKLRGKVEETVKSIQGLLMREGVLELHTVDYSELQTRFRKAYRKVNELLDKLLIYPYLIITTAKYGDIDIRLYWRRGNKTDTVMCYACIPPKLIEIETVAEKARNIEYYVQSLQDAVAKYLNVPRDKVSIEVNAFDGPIIYVECGLLPDVKVLRFTVKKSRVPRDELEAEILEIAQRLRETASMLFSHLCYLLNSSSVLKEYVEKNFVPKIVKFVEERGEELIKEQILSEIEKTRREIEEILGVKIEQPWVCLA